MNSLIFEGIFYGAFISFLCYEFGLLLRRKFKLAILNPLLIAVCCVIAVNGILKIEYTAYESSAKYISYFLTPATVCLAVPLYKQMELLKKNWMGIIVGIISGIIAGGLGTLALAFVFNLNHSQYVTMLPKSVTTAIGIGISQELGGIAAITTALIVITGIVGNIIGEFVFKLFKINNPIAKGIALGNSAHAIGTAKAIEIGEVEGAMSGLAIAVAGLFTVIFASIFANIF